MSSTQSSTFCSSESESLKVMQSLGVLCSSLKKQPFVGSEPPPNLSLALPSQVPKFGFVDFPGVSALCPHWRSEPAFLATHLFLLTRHLLCGSSARPVETVVARASTPHTTNVSRFFIAHPPR